MTHDHRQCRRCGTLASTVARYCSHCGARLGEGEGREMGGPSFVSVLSSLGLAIAAIVLGALGACFLLSGFGALSSGPAGGNIGFALLMWLVAAAAFFGVARMFRS